MEKDFFDEKSKCDAFDRIAEHFFCKNFGSMQKSEFELLLFSIYTDRLVILSKNPENQIPARCDDYTISKELGITQRVVNNLKIKKALKYPKNDAASWKEELPSIISNASYESGRIKLYIENPVVRMELEHILVNQGNFADYFFNPHILSLTPLCFLSILPLISESGEDEIKKSIIKQIAENTREEKELSKKIESDSFSRTLKEKGVELALDVISNVISDVIPAGDLLKEPMKRLSARISKVVSSKKGKNSSE